ncbi:LrgB family protein [Zhongshania sp.]|jgi:putative effector of murein hydrolase|uniref:LrgB family protein n=1 Tax=Zhongshania sp. TaxID=1971902 RepID=UPI001B61F10A|nr:LrgB family protein [Zhongshania sp.]MBQ0797370.1 LrgB family protein [Zhongshania sp.]|tara:strand:- start:980 stop:1675 length:696 start_codon:yes stop_codon:yes gene_type:complete
MNELIRSPLFAIVLTLLAYQGALFLYTRSGRVAMLHPTISGAVLIALALVLLQQDYQDYYQKINWLTFLLGPATVALAVPLYRQLHLLRNMAGPLLITVCTGAVFASTSALIIAWLFGANRDTLLSLTTKSITTPIAITVTQDLGGITTIAVASVILTGVVGITTITWLFNKLDIQDDRLWGFCLGLAAHAIGTSRAFERSPVAGAFSSLALCLTGAFTAIVVPFAARWFL